MTLSGEQIKDYVRQGGTICPYCGSREIEGGTMDADGDYVWCVVDCNNCHMQWQDSYRLVGLIEMSEGPFSDMVEHGENK